MKRTVADFMWIFVLIFMRISMYECLYECHLKAINYGHVVTHTYTNLCMHMWQSSDKFLLNTKIISLC